MNALLCVVIPMVLAGQKLQTPEILRCQTEDEICIIAVGTSGFSLDAVGRYSISCYPKDRKP